MKFKSNSQRKAVMCKLNNGGRSTTISKPTNTSRKTYLDSCEPDNKNKGKVLFTRDDNSKCYEYDYAFYMIKI